MSAWIVTQAHIAALVNAGLAFPTHGGDRKLSWQWEPLPDPAEEATAHERGTYWGPGYIELAKRRRHELTRENAQLVGQMLLAENYRSVNHRYNENEEVPAYVHKHAKPLSPVVVLKALACYEHQACEGAEWRTSQAKAFCNALRKCCIEALPGYDEAPWGIKDGGA